VVAVQPIIAKYVKTTASEISSDAEGSLILYSVAKQINASCSGGAILVAQCYNHWALSHSLYAVQAATMVMKAVATFRHIIKCKAYPVLHS
jgi:hypothetical protein